MKEKNAKGKYGKTKEINKYVNVLKNSEMGNEQRRNRN